MLLKSEKTSLSNYYSIFILIFAVLILSAGCQKKAEQPEGEKPSKDTTKMVTPEKPKVDTTAKADTTKMYPDLTGKWTGTFDKRSTTFNITEQNGENFKGSMTIAYKQPLNKDISGKIKSGGLQLTMRDLTHSRFMGNYSGKISNDGNKISGTFTMNADKSSYSFTFSKK